eukprot:TRINITY_DN45099_c0_g1_i1.p1 TRINITY_DN45099_c0_g1~~TRINITY_DN45099_c0_g1_i1.p1  ORF type:complete len:694 (-),score=88.62 TRINITY_DN45099_c0_g1_i1:278-2065(-)
MGDGTIWGLICESPPILAGVLIRRLLVDRLDNREDGEIDLDVRHRDSVLFALDEYPFQVAIYEILARNKSLRLAFALRGDALRHASDALEALRALVMRVPAERLDTDRGLVGRTSAVYGVRDSDAFFVEADLFASIICVLTSSECQALLASAVHGGAAENAAAAQRICLHVADIADQLHAHPYASAGAVAVLGSAVPIVFGRDERHTNPSFWTLAHMLLTSRLVNFVEEVLQACAKTRMHDASDLAAVRSSIFGEGHPTNTRVRSTSALNDVRVLFCQVVLLLFHLLEALERTQTDRPERFTVQSASLFKEAFLPVLRRALDEPIASRWSPVRDALGALVVAAERLPVSSPTRGKEAAELLVGARSAFHSFAVGPRFFSGGIVDDGGSSLLDDSRPLVSTLAQQQKQRRQQTQNQQRRIGCGFIDSSELLDPFGHKAVAMPVAPAIERVPFAAAAELRCPRGNMAQTTAAEAASLTAAAAGTSVVEAPSTAVPSQAFELPTGTPLRPSHHHPLPLGPVGRKPGMHFFTLTESKLQPMREPQDEISDLADKLLPKPLPFSARAPSKAGVVCRRLPSIAGRSPRGFFYNKATAQYVS